MPRTKPDPLERYLRRPGRRRLARVVDAHRQFVWDMALRVTSNRDDAADVCQDVFLGLLLDPPDPDRVASPRGYLAWCVIGRARRLRRAREREAQREREHALRLRERLEAAGVTVEDLDSLRRALDELPEELRFAIELRYLAELSPEEVASTLGITQRAVRMRLDKARELLRRRLGTGVTALLVTASPFGVAIGAPPDALVAGLERIVAMGQSLGAAAASSSLAGAGATASAGRAVDGFLAAGVWVMSAKKLIVASAISVATLVGAWLAFGTGPDRPGSRHHVSTGDGALLAPDVEASRQDVSRQVVPEESSPPAKVSAESEDVARSPALRGRIHDVDGTGIPDAIVRALDLTEWQALCDHRDEDAELMDRAGVRALRESLLRSFRGAPSTASGEDGVFSFPSLPPGAYRLVVGHPDHLPATDTLVHVRDGDTAGADIELSGAAAIGGRITDAAGAPVPGASVEARVSDGRSAAARERLDGLIERWKEGRVLFEPAGTTTDADGRFRLSSLEPVPHDLTVHKSGFAPRAVWQVPSGTEDLLVELDEGMVVRGRVVDPRRRPVPDAVVELARHGGRELHRIFNMHLVEDVFRKERWSAATDAKGRFRIAGLEEAAHDLVVRAADYPLKIEEVDPRPGEQDLGDIELAPAAMIAGTVLASDGRPLSGAEVLVPWSRGRVTKSNSALSRSRVGSLASSVSGDDGRFVLEGLPSATLTVVARHPLYVETEKSDVEAGSTDLELRLGRGFSIVGTVRDQEGTPVDGAQVRIGFDRPHRAITDARGAFEAHGIPGSSLIEGRVWLMATHSLLGSAREPVTFGATRDREEVDLVLSSLDSLAVTVLDPAGRPVPGAAIALEAEPLSSSDTERSRVLSGPFTDAEGRASIAVPAWLRSERTPHRLYVLVRHRSHATAREGPIEPEEALSERMVRLAAGTTVAGTVRDEGGRPVAGARVRLRAGTADASEEGFRQRVVFSSRDGRYRVTHVPEGPAGIEISAQGFARKREEVTIRAPETPLDWTLEVGRRIEGRVVDQVGRPLRGVQVVAAAVDEATSHLRFLSAEFRARMELFLKRGPAWDRSDDDGRFVLENLPDGVYTVVARAEGYDPAGVEGVRPGDVVETIVLERFSALRGIVLEKSTRRPIPRFRIEVVDLERRREMLEETRMADYRIGSQGALRFEDALGRFLYDGLRSVDCAVYVHAHGFRARKLTLKLDSGEEKHVEVLLERGASLRGRVLEVETDRPVAGAWISVNPRTTAVEEMWRVWQRTAVKTEADGTFVASGLATGEHTIDARHRFYMSGRAVRVTLPSDRDVEIRLRPAGRIEGRLTGAGPGRSENGEETKYRVRRYRTDGSGEREGFGETFVQSDGRFGFQGLEPGTYRLEVVRQVYRPGKQVALGPDQGIGLLEEVGGEVLFPLADVEVRAGETTEVEGRAP